MDYLFALQSIRESAPGFINIFFIIISEYVILAGMMIPAVIYWSIDKSGGATILFGYGLSFELNQAIKNIACVYRPWIKDSRLYVEPHATKSATGYSFPSGHTTTAASIYGGVAEWKKDKKSVVAVMCILILITAFARNWLGAHTIQDVICAVVFVGIWLSLLYLIKYWISKNPSMDTAVCFAGIVLAVILLIVLCVKKYPVDYAADGSILVDPYHMLTDCFSSFGCITGSLLGWWLERHFIKFSTDVSKKQKWLRAVTGLIVDLLIYATFNNLFSFAGTHIAHAIKYFTIFFYAFYIHPLLFTKIVAAGNK